MGISVEDFDNKNPLTMDLLSVLTELGLTEKEAKLYLAALELGPSNVADLSLRAKVNRVSCYHVLEKLMERGYISTYTEDKNKIFAATDPDLIRQDFRDKYMDLKQALPDLRRLNGKTAHPRVRYYEGIEGIKKVYLDTLSTKSEILNYADSKSIRQVWPSYDKDYVNERVKRNIYLRGISPHDEHGVKVAEANASQHRDIRLVPPGKFAFHNEINIYDDKVSIISFGKDELLAMIIESREIAETQRAIFMLAWSFANQLNFNN